MGDAGEFHRVRIIRDETPLSLLEDHVEELIGLVVLPVAVEYCRHQQLALEPF